MQNLKKIHESQDKDLIIKSSTKLITDESMISINANSMNYAPYNSSQNDDKAIMKNVLRPQPLSSYLTR